jgi:hypothetical protein
LGLLVLATVSGELSGEGTGGTDGVVAEPSAEGWGDADGAVGLDIVFEDGGEDAWETEGGAVEGMDGVGFASVFGAVTDASSACLKVGKVGTGGDFEPTFLSACPDFNVVLFGVGESDVAGANEDDAVGEFKFLQEASRVVAEGFEFVEGGGGVDPFDEFDFVKLVKAIEAAHVGTPTSCFAAEARGVGATFEGEAFFGDNFVAEKVGDGDFCGRNQVKIFGGDVIHLSFFIRELTGGGCTGWVDKEGGEDFFVAVGAGFFEEELYEGTDEACHVAYVKWETCAGGSGSALEVHEIRKPRDIPMGACVWGDELDRVAPGENLRAVGFCATVGDGFVGSIGDGQVKEVPLFVGFGGSFFEFFDAGGCDFQFGDFGEKFRGAFGCGCHCLIGGVLGCTCIFGIGDEGASFGVEGEDSVPFDLKFFSGEGCLNSLEVFTKELDVQHGTGAKGKGEKRKAENGLAQLAYNRFKGGE